MIVDLVGKTLNYINTDCITEINVVQSGKGASSYKHTAWEHDKNFYVSLVYNNGIGRNLINHSLRACLAYKEDLLNFLLSGMGLFNLHRYNINIDSDETKIFIDERCYNYTIGTNMLALNYNIPESTRWKILEMIVYGLKRGEILSYYDDGDAFDIVTSFVDELIKTKQEIGLEWLYKNKD